MAENDPNMVEQEDIVGFVILMILIYNLLVGNWQIVAVIGFISGIMALYNLWSIIHDD